jgi:putative effector of murein hydrolase LrgA (UPF0299 family)
VNANWLLPADDFFPSNLKQSFASKSVVIARRKPLLLGVLSVVLLTGSRLTAVPIEPTAKELLKEMERRPVMFVPARVGWHTARKPAANLSLTLEQYGPQATARAVRASLGTALVPDPLAMASLLFCAFALRWIRLRKDQVQKQVEVPSIVAQDLALPRAA